MGLRRAARGRARGLLGDAPLQHRPAHLRERSLAGPAARQAGCRVAVRRPRGSADRALHGRTGRPERLPLRRARPAQLERACAARRLPGSPHLGADLEKGANVLGWALRQMPETRALGTLVDARSAGIKDLRFGSCLAEDWCDADADEFLRDRCREVPFLPGADYYFVAAAVADGRARCARRRPARAGRQCLGASARRRRVPFEAAERISVQPGFTTSPSSTTRCVYDQLTSWLARYPAVTVPSVRVSGQPHDLLERLGEQRLAGVARVDAAMAGCAELCSSPAPQELLANRAVAVRHSPNPLAITTWNGLAAESWTWLSSGDSRSWPVTVVRRVVVDDRQLPADSGPSCEWPRGCS